MRTFRNDTIDETYYVETLKNGLTVYLMPKRQFYKSYAIFSTKYGSQDLVFTPIDTTSSITTPEGIAHFLEHKLFEQEDGTDASNLFAELGADVNAFTTASQTAYLFSTTSDLDACVTLLLDFVQHPHFTKKGVDKERGIIEQELLMYLDQPQSVQYFGILKAMYTQNNIRNEIGGTVQTIQQINEELLYRCYHTFYHPQNMVLAIVGNFDENHMIELIQENQSKKIFETFKPIERTYYLENEQVAQKDVYIQMDVTIPKVAIGIKLPHEELSSYEMLKRTLAFEMIMDIYFDESSRYYEDLLNRGIINNSFSYDIYYEKNYGHLLWYLDTQMPEQFIDEISNMIQMIHDKAIEETDFNRFKRLYQARNIKRFNSLEYIANLMVEFEHNDLELFDLLRTADEINLVDVEYVKKYFVEEAKATFTIYPNKK